MSLKIDPHTTASVLIDLQRGILSRPLEPHTAEQVIEKSAILGRTLSGAGGTLVLVHVGFAGNYADVPKPEVDFPMQLPPGGMPKEFAEFVPAIAALPADVIIIKRQWGAFHGTELDLQLRRRGIKTILLGGVATNFGVESTAREAWQHNYSVIVAEDCCAGMGAEMHRFSIEKIMPRISKVRSTSQIIESLGS